jgi:hypothetical protein
MKKPEERVKKPDEPMKKPDEPTTHSRRPSSDFAAFFGSGLLSRKNSKKEKKHAGPAKEPVRPQSSGGLLGAKSENKVDETSKENSRPQSSGLLSRTSSRKGQKKSDESTKDNGRPQSSGLLSRRGSRAVIPGLPRPLTFKRMQSEMRDKLEEVPPEAPLRRAASTDRKNSSTTKRDASPPPIPIPSMSAPDMLSPRESDFQQQPMPDAESVIGGGPDSNIPAGARQVDYGDDDDEIEEFMRAEHTIIGKPEASLPVAEPKQIDYDRETEEPDFMPSQTPTIGGGPDSNIPAGAKQIDYGVSVDDLGVFMSESKPPLADRDDAFSEHGSHRSASDIDDIRLQEELEAKWILNLSMHFRDMSDREKFFVTFAEEPNRWRRVTVSCDYRHLEPDSLESDLKTLHYQRDKSSRIYEAIRDSLPSIQFYDTVTNLKLETTDGRLHVHVTEDVNEIIPYPSLSSIAHLDCRRFKENAISFDSHISGFVYKVSANNHTYIKKEIPGPDAVEEFLYEINALVSLQNSKSVIKFEGIIVDEQNHLIKGLLISYAEQGALVDMIYDFKPTGQLYWERRERWARQIVEGLSEIHEAGFVQGDFTLSNIVIDNSDNAKIIDINRRGCPVGWEPPELAKLIESGQRISIYIGVKSDLYQLGMVLWALAEQQDEPERQERPLTRSLDRHNTDVPVYFRDIIRACLRDAPRARPSAANLLEQFPKHNLTLQFRPKQASRNSVSTHRSDKEYIDPATAVDLEDISQHRRHSHNQSSFEKIDVPPTEYPASSGSYILPNKHSERGRSPGPLGTSHRNRSDCSPYPGHRSVMSLDDSEMENELASLPASRETRWEQVYVDGDTKLVQRGGGDIDVHDFGTQDLKDISIISPPSNRAESFLGGKTADDMPSTISMVTSLHPIEPHGVPGCLEESSEKDHRLGIDSKASFSDRVHHLAQAQTQHAAPQSDPIDTDDTDYHHDWQSQMPDSALLANLEYDVAMDSSATSTAPPSRVSTGFSVFDRPETTRRVDTGFSTAQGYRMPLHQDSGFGEPERKSFESESIRHSVVGSIKDLTYSKEDEARIDERLWNEKRSTIFGEGIRVVEPDTKTGPIPIFSMPASSASETKHTMSPPVIPSVGPTNVVGVAEIEDKALEGKGSNTTIRAPSPDTHHNAKTRSTSKGEEKDAYDAYFSSNADSDENDDHQVATSDLSDYLSHSISFDHGIEHYMSQRKETKFGPQGPKV